MLSIFLPLYNSMFFSKLHHFLPHPTSYAPFSRLSSNLCFHRSISISLLFCHFRDKALRNPCAASAAYNFSCLLSDGISAPGSLSLSVISSASIHLHHLVQHHTSNHKGNGLIMEREKNLPERLCISYSHHLSWSLSHGVSLTESLSLSISLT